MVYVQRQHNKKHDTRRITKSHRKSSVTAKKKKKKKLSEPKKKKWFIWQGKRIRTKVKLF